MKQFLNKTNNKLFFIFIMFFVTATLMLLVTVVVSVSIDRMEKTMEESVQNHLLSAAQAASTFLTVEELELFHTTGDMEKPEWESIRGRLKQFAENYRLLYVSYWRYSDGWFTYIVDNDEDEELMVTPNMFLDEDEVTKEAVSAIMAGESWVANLGAYSTSWHNLITGAAPVFNENGSVYGGVYVDLSDDIILAQRSSSMIMRTILVCCCILSVLSGFLGMWLYRKKAAQSENASRLKSQFLSSMSHEIRTPMNTIIGITQIEMQKDGLPKEYAEAFDKIYNSGNNLLGIINDILDLSKIEAGRLDLNLSEYDTPSLINDAVQINIVRIGSKDIKFIIDVDRTLPSKLYGDELRIKQILNNFLSNAIKYTNRGQIKLTISHLPEGEDVMLCITVEDTGQGMSQEDQGKLFSEYLRFNVENNRSIEGTGLGLSIVRKLVGMMNGTINVQSEYGKGSIFTVTLRQKSVQCEEIGQEISDRLQSFTFMEMKKSPKQNIIRESMPYGRVLVVDDVETNLFVAHGLLEPYKLTIEMAISGFEALDLIRDGRTYDIIFMDHMMPQMNGIETTQKIRSLGYNGTILALTANVLAGNKELFMKSGFDGFIPKPIDIQDLNSALNVFIRDKYPEEKREKKKEKSGETPQVHPSAMNTKLLEVFRRDAEKAIVTLRETAANGDIKLFTTAAHAMKSALANVGEREKSQTASALENAALNGDVEFITANTENFVQALERFVKELTPAESACVDETNLQEDLTFLAEQLQVIKTACETYDDAAIYAALDRLKEKPWRKETVTALETIWDTLYLHSDFDGAAEQASALLNAATLL